MRTSRRCSNEEKSKRAPNLGRSFLEKPSAKATPTSKSEVYLGATAGPHFRDFGVGKVPAHRFNSHAPFMRSSIPRWPQLPLQRSLVTHRRALALNRASTPRPPRPSGLPIGEIHQRVDERIRRIFREENPAVVEAVVEARREIWGDRHGGECTWAIAAARTDKAKQTKR